VDNGEIGWKNIKKYPGQRIESLMIVEERQNFHSVSANIVIFHPPDRSFNFLQEYPKRDIAIILNFVFVLCESVMV
jgi:hypothetical protein